METLNCMLLALYLKRKHTVRSLRKTYYKMRKEYTFLLFVLFVCFVALATILWNGLVPSYAIFTAVVK